MDYIEKVIYRLFSLLKLLYINIKYHSNFKCNILNSISFSTTFRIKKNGKIFLGNKVSTRKNVEFNSNACGIIEVGNNCFFNNNCIIASHKKIKIGKDCSFGPNVVIFDHDHDFRAVGGKKSHKYKSDEIIIGDNVWIGANSIVLKGVKIADNSVIAAGTIVKEDVSDNVVYHSTIKNVEKNIRINE